jgi:hypothetical protein
MTSVQISHTQDSAFTKRIKSFGWRTAMMVLAAAIAAVTENLGILELHPTATIMIGLVLGEISKALNNGSR